MTAESLFSEALSESDRDAREPEDGVKFSALLSKFAEFEIGSLEALVANETNSLRELCESVGLDPECDLEFADLSGIDLHEMDLSGVSLTGADVRGTGLTVDQLEEAGIFGQVLNDARTSNETLGEIISSLADISSIRIDRLDEYDALIANIMPSDELTRPCLTIQKIVELNRLMEAVNTGKGENSSFWSSAQLSWLVFRSDAPGVFGFGEDLSLIASAIRSQERWMLERYASYMADLIENLVSGERKTCLTVSLVEGASLGSSFSFCLATDFVIAERDATFGLPQMLFGLYDAFGQALLEQHLGVAMGNRVSLSNETYTAEQCYELGLVHHLVEPGEGFSALTDFIRRSERRLGGMQAHVRNKRRRLSQAFADSDFLVADWVEAALGLSDQNLKVMSRLVSAQERVNRVSSVA